MMQIKYRLAIMIMFLLLIQRSSNAQESINALNHLLQKRPTIDSLPSNRFIDNCFLSFGIGMESTINGITVLNGRSRSGLIGSLNFGTWISSVSGIRMGIEGGIPQHQLQDKVRSHFLHLGLTGDYLFHLSNYLNGYDPKRRFEFIPIVGAGVHLSLISRNQKSIVGSIRGGFQASLRLNSYLYTFIEPTFNVFTDQFNHQTNWRNFDAVPSIKVGLTYKMNENKFNFSTFDQGSFWDRTFLSTAVGVNTLLKTASFSQFQCRNLGVSSFVGVGSWITPSSALRLGVGGDLFQIKNKYFSVYSGYLDYLLNLRTCFDGYDEQKRFNFLLLAGVGLAFPEKLNHTSTTVGANVGFQANYRLTKTLELFLEPKLGLYNHHFAGGVTVSRMDIPVYTLVGITLHRSKDFDQNRYSLDNNKFFDNLFISTGVGLNMSANGFIKYIRGKSIQPFYSLQIGKHLNTISSLRLNSQIGLLGEVDYKNNFVRSKLLGVGMDYLFDITNFVRGYNVNRLFNLKGVLGVTAYYNTRPKVGENYGFEYGLQGGFQASVNVNSQLAIFVEPRLNMITNGLVNGYLPPLKKDLVMSASMGITYQLDGYSYNIQKSSFNKSNYFVSFMLGRETNTNMAPRTWKGGFVEQFYVGKHLSNLIALRLGYRHSKLPEIPRGVTKKMSKYNGFDYDCMVDLRTLTTGGNNISAFDYYLVGGVSTGWTHFKSGSKFVSGIHSAFSLNYKLNPKLKVLLEPRVDLYNKYFVNNNNYRNVDLTLSLQTGLIWSF